MDLDETLTWPFFDDGHRRFAQALTRWADATLPALPHDDVDAACRARVQALAEAGFLRAVVPAEHGGLHPRLDVRTLCLAREILAYRDGLADFAFAMQGLGTGSISMGFVAIVAARWFEARRGLVTGVLTAASATGQLIFLPIVAEVTTRHGWRLASLIVAAAAVGVFALLVVLDTLNPAERVAFVLHDMFAVPFDEIASLLETSAPAARQVEGSWSTRSTPSPD